MPTYVYRRADGTTFELTQRISADPLTHDPESGEPVERVISGGAGLQFKGSGFYLTDYVHPGSSERKEAAKADAPSTASSDSPTPKPAAKPSAKAKVTSTPSSTSASTKE